MISESSFYKDELKIELEEIKRSLKISEDNYEYEYFKIEKFLFVSAFIVRKIIEGERLSDEVESEYIKILFFKPKKNQSKQMNVINCHHIGEFYDLLKNEESNKTLRDICNILIHSYSFSFVTSDQGEVEGIFVNSSFTKKKFIIYLEINTYFDIIQRVIDDEIVYYEIRGGKTTRKSSKRS